MKINSKEVNGLMEKCYPEMQDGSAFLMYVLKNMLKMNSKKEKLGFLDNLQCNISNQGNFRNFISVLSSLLIMALYVSIHILAATILGVGNYAIFIVLLIMAGIIFKVDTLLFSTLVKMLSFSVSIADLEGITKNKIVRTINKNVHLNNGDIDQILLDIEIMAKGECNFKKLVVSMI